MYRHTQEELILRKKNVRIRGCDSCSRSRPRKGETIKSNFYSQRQVGGHNLGPPPTLNPTHPHTFSAGISHQCTYISFVTKKFLLQHALLEVLLLGGGAAPRRRGGRGGFFNFHRIVVAGANKARVHERLESC